MDDRAAAGDPTPIAHRGFAGENPENTVAAVEAADVDGLIADYSTVLRS